MDKERHEEGAVRARGNDDPVVPPGSTEADNGSGEDYGRLREELIEARAACRQLTRLLFSTSHELRTPLNGIVGFADLLLAGEPDDLRRDYLGTIRASAVDLLGTINDLLDVARMERGGPKLERRNFDVREQIEDALSLVSPRACAKNLELVAYVRPDVPRVLQGDPHRLRQVLLNLLGNAVKYTDSGSVMTCVGIQPAGAGGRELRVEIRDTGGGLDPAYRRPVDTHVQTDQGEFQGAGLGLWISRELVSLMGGRIGVQSRAGYGSQFWFVLPLGVPAKQPEPLRRFPRAARILVHEPHPVLLRTLCHMLRGWGLRPVAAGSRRALHRIAAGDPGFSDADLVLVSVTAETLSPARRHSALTLLAHRYSCPVLMLASPDVAATDSACTAGVAACLSKPIRERGLHRILERLLDKRSVRGMHPHARTSAPTETPAPQHGNPAHVLVVEDDPVSCKLVCELLKQRPVRVSVATNGADAVRVASGEHVDLVLMDIHLPGLDGVTATRHIQAAGGGRVPVVGLTADAVAEHRADILQAGLQECLYKPLDIVRFWEIVDGILGAAAGGGDGDNAQAMPAATTEHLMSMLVEELPGWRREIAATLKNYDLPGLAEAAHGLAGAASYCGQRRLKDTAQWVVREARSGDRTRLAAASAALVAAMDEVLMQAGRTDS